MILIYKTLIIPVKCSKLDYEYLLNQNSESAKVWNRCVELDKAFTEFNGRGMRFQELQTALLGFSELPRRGVYYVYRKYLFARSAMWKSRKAKHKNSYCVKLPYKEKKYYNSGWDKQSINANYDKGIIKLARKASVKGVKHKPVICKAKTIPRNIVEIELIYRGKLYLAIKYKEDDMSYVIQSNNSCSIDFGEIHAITAIDTQGHATIITGRKLRSIKRLRNKKQNALRVKQRLCTKDSRMWNRYARAIRKIGYKTDAQLRDGVHKITKLFVDYCLQYNISTVYYGELDSCTRGTKGRINSHVGQKLNEWCYGRMLQQLENKLGRYGIKLVCVSEAWSSQTCPVCGCLNKTNTRNYSCECGYEQHRDIVGAINILNFNAGTNLSRYTTKTYLRIA